MPTVIVEEDVAALCAAFKSQRSLHEVPWVLNIALLRAEMIVCRGGLFPTEAGMAFVIDHSGKLFKGKKVTLRDIAANSDVPYFALFCGMGLDSADFLR